MNFRKFSNWSISLKFCKFLIQWHTYTKWLVYIKPTTTWFLVPCHFKTQNRCGREKFMFIVLFKKSKHPILEKFSDEGGCLWTITRWGMRCYRQLLDEAWGVFCFALACKPDEGGDTEQVIKLSWPNDTSFTLMACSGDVLAKKKLFLSTTWYQL